MKDWHWPTTSPDRLDVAAATVLAVAVAAGYAVGLEHPAAPIFDEVLHVIAADELLQGLPLSDVAHPPGARWLIALGLEMGPGPFDILSRGWTPAHAFAWRLPSVLAASLAVFVLALLGRCLGLGRAQSLFAAALLALDGFFLVHARIGMTNIFSLTFILLGAGATWLALRDDRPAWLPVAGLALGAAVATRWTGAVAVAALAGTVLALRRPWSRAATARLWEHWAIGGILGFVVLPAVIYAAVFLPSVWPQAASILDLGAWTRAWDHMVALNARMAVFHEYSVGIHPSHSAWWSWPWMWVPLWYFVEVEPVLDAFAGIVTLGNPMLWFPAVPAWIAVLLVAWRSGRAEAAFVGGLGMALWVAWGLTGRTTTFSTYFGECLPWAALAIALCLGLRRRSTLWLAAWLSPAVAWMIWMYPLQTGRTMTIDAYAARMALPGWELTNQSRRFREAQGLEGRSRYHRYLNGLGNRRWGLVSGPSPSPSPSPR